MEKKYWNYIHLGLQLILILLALFLPILNFHNAFLQKDCLGYHLFQGLSISYGEIKQVLVKGKMLYWLFVLLPIFSILFSLQLSSKVMQKFLPLLCSCMNFALIIALPFQSDSFLGDAFATTKMEITVSTGYYILLFAYLGVILYQLIFFIKSKKSEK